MASPGCHSTAVVQHCVRKFPFKLKDFTASAAPFNNTPKTGKAAGRVDRSANPSRYLEIPCTVHKCVVNTEIKRHTIFYSLLIPQMNSGMKTDVQITRLFLMTILHLHFFRPT